MTRYLPTRRQVARKTYTCNACEWIDALLPYDLLDYKLTYAELREIVKARRNHWQIVPGQEYIKQAVIYDNHEYGTHIETWRAIPAIDAICRKYEIYDYV